MLLPSALVAAGQVIFGRTRDTAKSVSRARVGARMPRRRFPFTSRIRGNADLAGAFRSLHARPLASENLSRRASTALPADAELNARFFSAEQFCTRRLTAIAPSSALTAPLRIALSLSA
jgi:hypothetical protein